jgi:protein-disulfide isomerase
MIDRRGLLTLGGIASIAFAARGRAKDGTDPANDGRTLGHHTAPLVVQEWFSLTCSHCAEFARLVFPRIRTQLIDTGRIEYRFRDMPFDRLALQAAAVARRAETESYEQFVQAMLNRQGSWAFAHDGDPRLQLKRQAALAGISAQTFDNAIHDELLMTTIVDEAHRGIDEYKIGVTPTFVFGHTVVPGALDFSDFVAHVDAAIAQPG